MNSVTKQHEIIKAVIENNLTEQEASELLGAKSYDEAVENYYKVVENNLKEIIGNRYSDEELKQVISEAIGTDDILFNEIEDIEIDYNIMVSVFDTFGYVDIYYLKEPKRDKKYITEIYISN